jgi:hypothetical protein
MSNDYRDVTDLAAGDAFRKPLLPRADATSADGAPYLVNIVNDAQMCTYVLWGMKENGK